MISKVPFLCVSTLVLGAVWLFALYLWPEPTASQHELISTIQTAIGGVATALFVTINGKG